jgi:tRNA(Arg) A34 adenosine deaminase TadA
MMLRCIALAMQAADCAEYCYAAIVSRAGEIVCEVINSVRQDRDASHHAELLAITKAYHRLDRVSLEDCTLYANAEPCALCSYAIRESRIGRVVYGLPAPLTGGMSHWNILGDHELSKRLPEVFAPPPEIVPGFMAKRIEAANRLPLPGRMGIHSGAQHFWRTVTIPPYPEARSAAQAPFERHAYVHAAPQLLRLFGTKLTCFVYFKTSG